MEMTYQVYNNHLKVSEFLDKEPTGQYKKVHDFLTKLWNGMEIVVNSHNDRLVLQKEEGWVFVQDDENGILLCQKYRVWSFFIEDMGMNFTETQDFIKSAVNQHLKCVVGTPHWRRSRSEAEVEQHLKCEVGTPYITKHRR